MAVRTSITLGSLLRPLSLLVKKRDRLGSYEKLEITINYIRVKKLRNNYNASVGHVRAQVPGLFILERSGVVHFDIEAGAINVEFFAVS